MASFASLGTVLVDNFHYYDTDKSENPRIERHLGGGGLYAAIGARMWLEPQDIEISVGGRRPEEDDDLSQVFGVLDEFGEDMWQWDPEQDVLQANIEYRGQERSFRYLNPRPQPTLTCLRPSTISSLRVVHFCCSPSSLAESLSCLGAPRPLVIYEPLPPSCTPVHLADIVDLLPQIDVFSPNHEEMASLLDRKNESVERLTQCMRDLGARTVVVRAGARGCYVSTATRKAWIPAYFTLPDVPSDQVKGTTGAGNSFLGGLAAGLVKQLTLLQRPQSDLDIIQAAQHGSVSASFVVQQTGLPRLTHNEKGEEVWNGETPRSRIRHYK
ncbi:Ribokinase-like protein [Hymenopellis radicata]|nr:Ribokinase-like protein [Hymenopellis radicata]